jgi:hypothetical protein
MRVHARLVRFRTSRITRGGFAFSDPSSIEFAIVGTRRDKGRLAAVCLLVVSTTQVADAEQVAVPVTRQAELLVRVAAYDRNLPARAGGKVHVLLLTQPDDTDSRTTAAQMDAALRRFDAIAHMPFDVTTANYPGGAALAAQCRSAHYAIVYVTPGLDARMPEMAQALAGVDVMTIASLGRYVAQGSAIGFDLESGRPSLLINLTQAKKQNVAIEAEVLHLMKVIQ